MTLERRCLEGKPSTRYASAALATKLAEIYKLNEKGLVERTSKIPRSDTHFENICLVYAVRWLGFLIFYSSQKKSHLRKKVYSRRGFKIFCNVVGLSRFPRF